MGLFLQIVSLLLSLTIIFGETVMASLAKCEAGLLSPQKSMQMKVRHTEDAKVFLNEQYVAYLELLTKTGQLDPAAASRLQMKFRLVVEEMLENAQHCGNQEKDKLIFVRYVSNKEGVEVTISDQSGFYFDGLDPDERVNRLGLRARLELPYDPELITRRKLHNHEPEREHEGGRGIFLAESFTSAIRYEKHINPDDGTLEGTSVVLIFIPLELVK